MSIESPCFSYGKFYVVCYRVKKSLALFDYTLDNKTKNIAYQKALQRTKWRCPSKLNETKHLFVFIGCLNIDFAIEIEI